MSPIIALAVEPIAKVLAKAAANLALKLHNGMFHEIAERKRKEIEAAKNAAKVLILMAVLSASGCMAYNRAFVAIHDSIDEALKDKTEQKVDGAK